ncbi:hypothetical protein ACSBR1_013869 [Camellia fascicularis]
MGWVGGIALISIGDRAGRVGPGHRPTSSSSPTKSTTAARKTKQSTRTAAAQQAQRIISRKKQFDENVSKELTQLPEESFRVVYFLYFVDQALQSLKSRFEQFKVYETNFAFLFDLKKCRDESLKAGCMNLEEFLNYGDISDIDGAKSLEREIAKRNQ